MEHALVPFMELKFSGNDSMSFAGYASVFNVVDDYGDVIVPGAFAESLAESRRNGRWPLMFLNHGVFAGGFDYVPIGVWTDMAEDGKGLYVEGKLADTERGREVYALMKMKPRPALDGLSIGYNPKRWTSGTKPKEPRRTLEAVDLIEVSVVSLPANPKAKVTSVKHSEKLTIFDAERALRAAGFSHNEVKAILAHGFRDVDCSCAEDEKQVTSALLNLVKTLRS